MPKHSEFRTLNSEFPLILASASPRRAALLREAGFDFQVIVSPVREPHQRPRDVPIEIWPCVLAHIKAAAVQKHLRDKNAIILGADTIVLLDNRILNKPRDRAHARHMLSRLFGRQHQVITGICLLRGDTLRLSRAVSTCFVRRPSKSWLDSYLDSNLWKGKAGAYGIQDSDQLVQLRSGEFSNVMGLPLQLLTSELASLYNRDRQGAPISSPH